MPRSCELCGASGNGIGEVDGEAGGQQAEGSQVGGGLDDPLPQASPLLPPGYADLAIEGEETCRGSPPLDSRSVQPGKGGGCPLSSESSSPLQHPSDRRGLGLGGDLGCGCGQRPGHNRRMDGFVPPGGGVGGLTPV